MFISVICFFYYYLIHFKFRLQHNKMYQKSMGVNIFWNRCMLVNCLLFFSQNILAFTLNMTTIYHSSCFRKLWRHQYSALGLRQKHQHEGYTVQCEVIGGPHECVKCLLSLLFILLLIYKQVFELPHSSDCE